nr:hypothetical protein CFP56_05432 [Quercus suber]
MLERRRGDSRNDVRLSLGGIVRHVDLKIRSFFGYISLYFVFAAVTATTDTIVSFFWVGSLVEYEFVVGGGDEIGFGCGFHVLRVESCR